MVEERLSVDLAAELVKAFGGMEAGRQPIFVIQGLTIHVNGGVVKTECSAATGEPPPFRHSVDYRCVRTRDATHYFGALQAACIKLMHEAWLNGTPELSSCYLLSEIESESGSLGHLFQRNDAWKTLVIPGKTPGTYRLNLPDAA